MISISFELPGKPSAWQRAQKVGKRHFNLSSMTAAQHAIAHAAAPHTEPPFGPDYMGPLSLSVCAVFATPKSWSAKKTRLLLGSHHAQKPDASNISKQVEDALNGIAYHDDSQVAETRCVKLWGATAKTVITLQQLEDRR